MGEVYAPVFYVSRQITVTLSQPSGIERSVNNRECFRIEVGPFDEAMGVHDVLPLRLAATPPGYSSGLVLIFREPQLEHFMCLPTSGTGVSAGSGTVVGLTSRSWPQSQQ